MLPTELFSKIFKLVSSGIPQSFDWIFTFKIYLDIFKTLIKNIYSQNVLGQIRTQQTSLEH